MVYKEVQAGAGPSPKPVDGVRAQVESGIVYGLSAALKGAITIKEGAVEQVNFNDYDVLRIGEMPEVETHIVPSDAPPTGTGEPATFSAPLPAELQRFLDQLVTTDAATI